MQSRSNEKEDPQLSGQMLDPAPDRFSEFWPPRSGPKRTNFLDFTTMSGQQFQTQKAWEVVRQIWLWTGSTIFNLLCKNMSCLVVKYVDLGQCSNHIRTFWCCTLKVLLIIFWKSHTFSWIEQTSPSQIYFTLSSRGGRHTQSGNGSQHYWSRWQPTLPQVWADRREVLIHKRKGWGNYCTKIINLSPTWLFEFSKNLRKSGVRKIQRVSELETVANTAGCTAGETATNLDTCWP